MNERVRAANLKRDLYVNMSKDRSPVGLSAANYYFLVLFMSATLFVVVLAMSYDGYEELPWMAAALAAATLAFLMVLFREVVLRRTRARARAARRLSHQLQAARGFSRSGDEEDKLTIQRNEELIREIRAKSDAAKVLGKLADAHMEVFELCGDYLSAASAEIARARAGSPRIPALKKGSASAARRHRFHMLKWAEIKARSFTAEASNSGRLTDKIDAAEEALQAVETAIRAYPSEPTLADSLQVLQVFLISARVKTSIDKGDRAGAKGSFKRAVDHYRDALEELSSNNVVFAERERITEKIRSEIVRLTKLADIQP